MDPLSQGLVGATAAQTAAPKKHLITASLVGVLSGMVPDLDVFIRSSHDPLLALEFHRQFTHSLAFIPLGALICATLFWLVFQTLVKEIGFKRIYLYSFLGYASHGLLDAFTSYGTQLYWPFSDTRVAWNSISIIDPLFTIPILLLLLVMLVKKSKAVGYLMASYAVIYLGIGSIQEQRATNVAYVLAHSRGHQAINLNVKPSFMNLIVWKSIYEYQGHYYVDALRVTRTHSLYPGKRIAKLDLERDLNWLEQDSQQAKDVERFRWFSADHLAIDPDNPNRIIDMRYSMLPNKLDGLWGILLNPNAAQQDHITWTTNRSVTDRKQAIAILWQMVINPGQAIGPVQLSQQ